MHPHDIKWAASELFKINAKIRDALMEKYRKRFNEIMADKSIPEHQREQAARTECNNRLREAVIKINKQENEHERS